jgi:hypothetical protein
MNMREAAWIVVMVIGGLGLALLVLSLGASAIQQAAVGSMVTGFVACAFVIAYGATAYKRRTAEIKTEREQIAAQQRRG